MATNIEFLRNNYGKYLLGKDNLDLNPLQQFKKWYLEINPGNTDELNAMSLSTVSQDGKPSSRIVLLRDFNEKGFIFYSNYEKP